MNTEKGESIKELGLEDLLTTQGGLPAFRLAEAPNVKWYYSDATPQWSIDRAVTMGYEVEHFANTRDRDC